MADVQSLYQMKRSANSSFDGNFAPFLGGQDPWTDRHGAGIPSALLHLNVQGLVANDLSYITTRITAAIPLGSDELMILFKLDNIPAAGISALKLKWKWRTAAELFTGNEFFIVVHQGRPDNISNGDNGGALYWVEGVETAPTTFSNIAEWQSPATSTLNTWIDLELTVNPALITDPDDLWISIETNNSSSRIIDISWMVLAITYPYARAETPTFKNYVNDLTKITNVSARQEGTKGTTKYCYRIVPCDASGVCGPASDEVVVTDGNATLDATNHICLTWEDDVGATNYKVYRTCGPSNLGIGLLETVLSNAGDCGDGTGGGFSGYKDDGLDCITDCDDKFDEDDLEGCQGVSSLSIGAKETPTTVIF